jgi:predicted transcriptional regulator
MKAIIEVPRKGLVVRSARTQLATARRGAAVDFHLSFESAKSLFTDLTPARLALLGTLRQSGPSSVYALAKVAERNHSNVHTDVARWEALGLIERGEDSTLSVPFDAVGIRLPLAQAALGGGIRSKRGSALALHRSVGGCEWLLPKKPRSSWRSTHPQRQGDRADDQFGVPAYEGVGPSLLAARTDQGGTHLKSPAPHLIEVKPRAATTQAAGQKVFGLAIKTQVVGPAVQAVAGLRVDQQLHWFASLLERCGHAL